jgi:hypothetical protein
MEIRTLGTFCRDSNKSEVHEIYYQRPNENVASLKRGRVREIVVIPDIGGLPDHSGISPDRLPFACRVDISAATPLSAFQGRDHGD